LQDLDDRRRQAEAEWAARQELAQREQKQRLQEIENRRQAALDLARLEQNGVEQRRADLEAEAERQREALAGREAALAARERRLAETAAALDARQERLHEAEWMHALALAELDRQRCEAAEERERGFEQSRQRHEEIEARARQAQEELDRERQALEERARQNDGRRAALRRRLTEIRQGQRDLLEMRLAWEELRRQQGQASPADVHRSLEQVRDKLSDQFRLADADLDDRKQELDSLEKRLEECRQTVARQRREVQQ
jgi:colicin import membrane protein